MIDEEDHNNPSGFYSNVPMVGTVDFQLFLQVIRELGLSNRIWFRANATDRDGHQLLDSLAIYSDLPASELSKVSARYVELLTESHEAEIQAEIDSTRES